MKCIKLFIISLFLITLSSCAEESYEGKEVESIEYSTVNYFGGFTQDTLVDLTNGKVYTRSYYSNETPGEYEKQYEFDVDGVQQFLDDIYNAGLFDLEDTYTTDHLIVDGGGWDLTIRYADGTEKFSTGSNNWPDIVFKEADYAFFYLYGEDLFNTLPYSFTNPPSIGVSIGHDTDSGSVHHGRGVSPINFTWHNNVEDSIDIIVYAQEHSPFEFIDGIEYELTIGTQNMVQEFSDITIYKYNLDGTSEEMIHQSGWFTQKSFDLELNKVYVIVAVYEYGTCEYAISTKITNDNNE